MVASDCQKATAIPSADKAGDKAGDEDDVVGAEHQHRADSVAAALVFLLGSLGGLGVLVLATSLGLRVKHFRVARRKRRALLKSNPGAEAAEGTPEQPKGDAALCVTVRESAWSA